MRESALLSLVGKCRVLALVLFIAVLAGCQQAPTGPQSLTDSDKQQITAVREALAKAVLAGDASAYAALYTEDAILLPAKGEGEMVRGTAEIQKRHSGWVLAGVEKAGIFTEFTLTPVEVCGVDGLAYVAGTFTETLTPPGSDSPVSKKGKYVHVFKKQADGSWKIAADIWNNTEHSPPQRGESDSTN